MRKLFFIAASLLISTGVLAQGKSRGKGKDKQKDNTVQNGSQGNGKAKVNGNDNAKEDKAKEDKIKNDEHDRKVWDGIGDNSCMKPSKNQPAKVRSSFQRDYPYAASPRWTKCRGDWTATFANGIFISTAVYHANGDRKDTRTPVTRENIPRKILDEIFKRRPDSRLDEVIKIEVPNTVKQIFRIKDILAGKTEFNYYDSEGARVTYDY